MAGEYSNNRRKQLQVNPKCSNKSSTIWLKAALLTMLLVTREVTEAKLQLMS